MAHLMFLVRAAALALVPALWLAPVPALATPMMETFFSPSISSQYAVGAGGLTTIRDPTTVACRFPFGTNPCINQTTLTFTVPQFDPTKGVLLQADLTFFSTTIFGAEVRNGSFTSSFSGSATVSGPAPKSTIVMTSAPSVFSGQVFNTTGNSKTQSVFLRFFGSTATITGPTVTATLASTITDLMDLSDVFTGLGVLSFSSTQFMNVTPKGSSAISGFNGVSFSPVPPLQSWGFRRTYQPRVSVKYTFEEPVAEPPPGPDQIPEPSTLALFAFGLAGLVFMARRRRRTA